MSLALNFSQPRGHAANQPRSHAANQPRGHKVQAAHQASPGMRLTRRGRLVLVGVPVMLLVGFLLVGIGFLTAPAQAGSSAMTGADASVVTVGSGDSIWSIAQRSNANRPAGDVVDDIVSLNALTSSTLIPGQRLLVPNR